MRWFLKTVVLGVLAAGLAVPLCLAQDLPARPQGYVSDFAGILSDPERQRIYALCVDLERKTGAQMAVVTVASTSPDTIEQYAVRLFEKWGIGQKGKDNGVLLLVAVRDRKVRIEVGYGLEGVLTDALSKSIIERFMVPAFRQEMYAQGISVGAAAVASVIAKAHGVSVTGDEQQVYQALQSGDQERRGSPIASFVLFVIFAILFMLNPRLFLYMMMFSMMGGWRRGGYWGGSGGGFGGGFGGFGGGMSGGGGASGGW